MTTSEQNVIQFRPSRVDGVSGVDAVRIGRDRLELCAAGGEWRSIPFLSFALGREIATGRVPVGQLHFSKLHYPDSHFVFFTNPQTVVYMPTDGPANYPHSHFWRVQELLRGGGFMLYDGDRTPPKVLQPASPRRIVTWVLCVLLVAWLYGLSGFLPGRAGEVARGFLLSNQRNPAIGAAFILPTVLIPMMLSFSRGSTIHALAWIVAGSSALAMSSEWAMRHIIHAWAPLEQSPYNLVFWSAHRFGTMLIVVILAAIIASTWRRGFLEPIEASEMR